MDLKNLLFAFFSAIGVVAFLAVVANEVEYLNFEQEARQKQSSGAIRTPPPQAEVPTLQAA